MDTLLFKDMSLAASGSLLAGAALALLLLAVIVALLHSEPSPALPRIGARLGFSNHKIWVARREFARNGHRLIEETYRGDKHKNFLIQTATTDRVILAPKHLDELRMLPENKLSSSAARVDSVVGQYSGVDILLKGHLGTEVIRGPLTKNLPRIVPEIVDELNQSLPRFLEDQRVREPALYSAYTLVYSIISQVTSRVFVGKRLCRDKVWVNAVLSFPTDAYGLGAILFPVPSFLRPFVAPFCTSRRRLQTNHDLVRELLFPASSLKQQSEELTVLNLMLHASKSDDADSFTTRLLLLTAAALHTSSMAAVHMIYDLCARREYVEPLRAEAQAVLSEYGGQWTMAALKKLYRLDSFMKESQRVNTVAFLGFDRKVMSPVALSDGTILPPDAVVSMPGGPMSRDEAYYPNPQQFDGFRFCAGKASSTEHDFTSIEPGNLNWGNGRWTCPGRWYASAMIKLLLATLLLDYDIKFPNGQTTRPPNVKNNMSIHPDFTQLVTIRKQTSTG